MKHSDLQPLPIEQRYQGKYACFHPSRRCPSRRRQTVVVYGVDAEGYGDVAEGYDDLAHTLSDDIILSFTGRKGLGMTSIAFWSDRSGHREIYVMDYDGHNQRQVSAHKSISMSPVWKMTRSP